MPKRTQPIAPKHSVGRWVYAKDQANAQPIKIIECEFVTGWGMYRYCCVYEDGSPVPLLFAASDLAPLDNFIPNTTNQTTKE